jgi:hypothetical protein
MKFQDCVLSVKHFEPPSLSPLLAWTPRLLPGHSSGEMGLLLDIVASVQLTWTFRRLQKGLHTRANPEAEIPDPSAITTKSEHPPLPHTPLRHTHTHTHPHQASSPLSTGRDN